MFRETTVHKWDNLIILPCLLYTSTRWTLAITFIGLLVTTNNITSFLYHWVWKACSSTVVLKNSILQSPFSLISRTSLWIESVSGMDGAWWILSNWTILSNLGKYTVIIDHSNFMAASENSLGVWTTIWPDFLIVPSTSSIGTLSWCP